MLAKPSGMEKKTGKFPRTKEKEWKPGQTVPISSLVLTWWKRKGGVHLGRKKTLSRTTTLIMRKKDG